MRAVTEYRCAVFDCDGVILASNEIKTRAFCGALCGETRELINAFVDYHQRHGGISRFVKFRHFFQVMKHCDDYEQRVADAVDRYARLVRAGLEQADLVPGVLETLDWLCKRGVPCFVVSGGAEDELRGVFDARGLRQYFAGIYGSPKAKRDHLGALQRERRIQAPGLFFGDAESDMDAADAHDLDFCLLYGYSDWTAGVDRCREKGHPFYRDFEEFLTERLPWRANGAP